MRAAGVILLVGLALAGCGNDDLGPDESGSGTVLIHVRLETGSPAAGAETYIVRRSTESRKQTDANGDARFEHVPAGSWDVGFSESASYISAGGATRRTMDVRDDATTEITFTVRRQTPPR